VAVYCNSRTHPRAVIRNGGSSGNPKFQSSNPKEYPIFKYKPTARGLKREPQFRIALVVGAWNLDFPRHVKSRLVERFV